VIHQQISTFDQADPAVAARSHTGVTYFILPDRVTG
jgi:hypothetical protein